MCVKENGPRHIWKASVCYGCCCRIHFYWWWYIWYRFKIILFFLLSYIFNKQQQIVLNKFIYPLTIEMDKILWWIRRWTSEEKKSKKKFDSIRHFRIIGKKSIIWNLFSAKFIVIYYPVECFRVFGDTTHKIAAKQNARVLLRALTLYKCLNKEMSNGKSSNKQ